MRPKKVAIIGAGPSGLVTAKTLLHDYPTGTFVPTIFEKRHEVGGLWPNSRQNGGPGPVNPLMRTNLSRFTVAFSDLAWESVIEGEDDELPMFPQAWQVGRYLEKYTERFILSHGEGVLRLGRRVTKTIRETDVDAEKRWTVQWVTESGSSTGDTKTQEEVESEQFDFLVIASGYFSSPHIPDIPGLHGFEKRTIHSSYLHNAGDVRRLLQRSDTTAGKLVVIGGSMSGAEAASTLALYLSSSNLRSGSSIQSGESYQVHHVCTRPFWTVPTYLPHEIPDPSSGKKKISFLPLDLAMYDLARRPPGPIEYAFGPVSSQQIKKTNDYFYSLLGSDYEKPGKTKGPNERAEEEEGASQPLWVAIGNDYAEYVRSRSISTTIGRVSSVHSSSHDSDPATIDIKINYPGDDNKTLTLDNIAAIILATGFTPYNSLSFLPPQVLSLLEYSENDPFLPLILDGKGTTNAEIPDIGFVGFYRGPYWGVMEMQARLIAKNWAPHPESDDRMCFSELEQRQKEEERQKVRTLREDNTNLHSPRGQFPMGDYIGLMESFSRDVGISRTPLIPELDNGEEDRSGPVVPARYTHAIMDTDKDLTLHSLRNILFPDQSDTPSVTTATATTAAMSMAIFRALHGSWKFTRTYHHHNKVPNEKVHGTATFHPQYPSDPAYEKEYLYEELESREGHIPQSQTTATAATAATPTLTPTNRSVYIYRFHEQGPSPRPGAEKPTTDTPRILIWSGDMTDEKAHNATLQFSHGLNLTMTPAYRHIDDGNEELSSGGYRYTVHATATGPCVTGYTYTFHFQGVAILSWECVAKISDESYHSVRMVYERD